MTPPNIRQTLDRLLSGDSDLYEQLCAAELLPRDDDALAPEHLETARVVRTLVHELEVNWAGVEVVLHMRSQLVATRQQLAELTKLVQQLQRGQR